MMKKRHTPGTIVAAGPDGVDVACGQDSIVRLAALQRAGGRRQPADAFQAGAGLRVLAGLHDAGRACQP